jgi:hypothetical protein
MEKGKIYKQSSIHSSSTKAANSAFTTPRRPEEDLKSSMISSNKGGVIGM